MQPSSPNQNRDIVTWRSNLWWRMPLIGALLSVPLTGPAVLFLAVYGSGIYADFGTLFLGSAAVVLGSVVVGAVLIAVPTELLVIRPRPLKVRQIALVRSLALAAWGLLDGYLIYQIVTEWLLDAPPPDALLPSVLIWVPLTAATMGLVYTLYEQFVEQMQTSARLTQELAVARAIQQDLFPEKLPQVPGLAFAAHCKPARETGGDFYDFIPLGKGRVGVVVADVAGKSIAAALLMANARSIWRAAAATGAAPKSVLTHTNRALCQDIRSAAFVTLFYAIVDATEPQILFSSAGHPPSLLCRGPLLRELSANGLPLGLTPDAEYQEAQVSLQPGDSLVLYTDGLVESLNPRREMFGFDRLHELLTRRPADRSQAIIQHVLEAVQAFCSPAEQMDDVTLVTIQLEGTRP